MRQYVIDELRKGEIEKIREFLTEHCEESDIKGLFWLKMPGDVLSPTQHEHKGCGPHCIAIEVGESWVKLEMLVRSRERIRCNCIQYATDQQRSFIMRFADNMLKQTGITV